MQTRRAGTPKAGLGVQYVVSFHKTPVHPLPLNATTRLSERDPLTDTHVLHGSTP